MQNGLIGSLIGWAIALLVIVAIAAWLLNRLYHRSTREMAFVRTGLGGECVVINGGALVLPIVHEVLPVNLNVLRIPIERTRERALITRDRMRVDIEAEFFVRVRQDPVAVGVAASTLGRRTLDSEALAELLASRFVAALRSAAATLSLDEMHEKRSDFIAALAEMAADALAMNGLELESVAITDLDQTDLQHFNPANRFDAEGLTRLIESIESRRTLRNDIEQSSVLAIRTRNLEAEKAQLELERDSERSRLEQEQALETLRAEQRTDIARTRAQREAEAEQARMEAGRTTREADIERQRRIDAREIEVRIELLARQTDEAERRVDSEAARARAVTAEEQVETAREVEIAERRARVDRLEAQKEADVAGVRAQADKLTAAVAAEAMRLRHEAENALSEDARATRLREHMIDRLEGIVRESVKPLENIDGIRILQVDGLGGGSAGPARSPTDEVIESALRYRAQAPLIDRMMQEIGIENAGVAKMGDLFRSARDAKALAEATGERASAAVAASGGAGEAGGSDGSDGSDGSGGSGGSGGSDVVGGHDGDDATDGTDDTASDRASAP